MSTSTENSRVRRGLETAQEVRRRRQEMLHERRQTAERRTAERLVQLGTSRDAAAAERAALLGRCDSLESVLPARDLDRVRGEIEAGGGRADAGQRRVVEELERQADQVWTRNREQRLLFREIASKTGATLAPDSIRRRGDGAISATLRFADGKQMKVSVGQGAPGGDTNPVEWHVAESNIPTCEEQHAYVRGLAERSGLDVTFDDDGSPGGTRAMKRKTA